MQKTSHLVIIYLFLNRVYDRRPALSLR